MQNRVDDHLPRPVKRHIPATVGLHHRRAGARDLVARAEHVGRGVLKLPEREHGRVLEHEHGVASLVAPPPARELALQRQRPRVRDPPAQPHERDPRHSSQCRGGLDEARILTLH